MTFESLHAGKVLDGGGDANRHVGITCPDLADLADRKPFGAPSRRRSPRGWLRRPRRGCPPLAR